MLSHSELERLYDEHAQAVFAFLLSMTRNEADTRDILQEVFIKLSRDADSVSRMRDERAFLIRMAQNLLIDFHRRRETRQRYHGKLSEESENLFVPVIDSDERQFQIQLTQALTKLPPEQRSVVHLKLWENMTFNAIAIAFDITPNTAASRYRYGIDKMRDLLRPLYEEIR